MPSTTSLERIFAEGHRLEAWHGPNLNHALAGITPAAALWRPAPARHNIAEIVLHHAFYLHSVRGRILGAPQEPFPTGAGDWSAVPGPTGLDWPAILALLEDQQQRLAQLLESLAAGRAHSPLDAPGLFDLALGITCHDAYHAGQAGLLKALRHP